MKYQVIHGTSQYIVYLSSKICTCRMCDILQISCAHTCGVLTMKHLSIKSYVSHYYLNNKLSSIYRGLINPLGDHQHWQVFDVVSSIVILLSNVKRSVGRPKKIRIPSKMEFKRRVKCGHCGCYGQKRKRCKFALSS